ncbi:hypothetical protein H0V99_03475 [Candidatus Saccharibacteria bacterium]|nr:hypothetical protein [Candidatus Saccharibacteria bacterium]
MAKKDTTYQPTQDSQGFVHIALDEPTGPVQIDQTPSQSTPIKTLSTPAQPLTLPVTEEVLARQKKNAESQKRQLEAIKERAEQIQKSQQEANTQLKEAQYRMAEANKLQTARKNEQPAESLAQDNTPSSMTNSILDNIQSGPTSVEPKPYQTFMLSGIALLVTALIAILYSKPFIVLLIILLGIAQIAFALMLKKKDQA